MIFPFDMKIAIIGLGYVGLPLAVEFSKKRKITAFDINADRVKELKQGIDNTNEVNESKLLINENLSLTSNLNDLNDCNVFIITVPTPIDEDNIPDLSFITKATEIVSNFIRLGAIVIYESTVYPGLTEEHCAPLLEKLSGLTFNEDFFCGYSPERINPGDKTKKITDIVKVTSGSTPAAAKIVDDLYSEIIDAGTFLARSIKVAEAAKVIENTQRDLNIALMNELAMLLNKMDIDVTEVLAAAKTKWNFLPFTPGLVGGHCIGVDPYYLTHKAHKVGFEPKIILAGREVNDGMSSYISNLVIKNLGLSEKDLKDARIAVLGVTFKENCPDIRNSKVFDLVAIFASLGITIILNDPVANPKDVFNEYGLELGSDQEIRDMDAIILAVPHRQFSLEKIGGIAARTGTKNCHFFDLKSSLPKNELENFGFQVFRL
jgi:UDP-N-acetyl-D-galactosamine dehydrogenase